ncbi:MAG TPA: hypothetical protein VGV93_09095 [Acidimicrobiales bacterium]|nr:hypothetical protein [Acidimicrobiales bacterium]
MSELVECSGERHRISWRGGSLVLEDHDLTAERTMRALGAETPDCLRLLKQWRDVNSWATSTELYVQMRARLGPERILAPGALGERHELALLLTWERAWRALSFHAPGHERLLADQLQARAAEPLTQHLSLWSQRLGCRQLPSIEVKLQRPGQTPRMVGAINRLTARLTVGLGVRWVLEVWARDLAVVDDGFVLEVTPGAGPVARAIRWEPQSDGGARPVVGTARLGRSAGGEWRLAWDPT